jgi:hypothetical protein
VLFAERRAPDSRYGFGQLVTFGGWAQVDQARIEGGVAAVVADLEHVVATSLQALPTESVRFTKRLLHRDKPDVLQVIDEESELFRERIHSVEAKEEVARFLK